MKYTSTCLLLFSTIYCSVLALDNGLALTPPMGWMSWAAFKCEINCNAHPDACINEQLYQQMADRLVSDGYRDVGYNHIHIDDCWMSHTRGSDGRLIPDPGRFPSGIKALSQYMHQRNLYLGIYEDYGLKTCQGYPGSLGHIQTDAETFAEWDCDYLKLDGCYMLPTEGDVGYPAMERALNSTGRPIMYSCEWPSYLYPDQLEVNYTQIRQSCNLWRNYHDIADSWHSLLSIINFYDKWQDKLIPAAGPGGWHDPDMLIIGMKPGVTVDQAKVQMSLWSIWSAPLIMSNDLRLIDPDFKQILLNRDVIAIDQDPLGIMGRLVLNSQDNGVYVKPVTPTKGTETSFAIAVLNRHSQVSYTVQFALSRVGLNNAAGYQVKDLWTKQDLGVMKPSDTLKVNVPPTGITLLKATII